MRHLIQFDSFLNESKINISDGLDQEIQDLTEAFLKNPECDQVDDGYIEIETPFEINPDSNNPDWKNKIGIVFYPELLTYREEKDRSGKTQRTPWICCRISLEGKKEDSEVRDLLKWLVSLIEKSGYKPFMDEDASWNHWRKEEKNGSTEYSCFVNPDYPEGHWENHALQG
jgi:hypothetical protein